MNNRKYDVVALGELLIDYSEYGVSAQGNPLWEANPGGAPCNLLAMLAKLGRKTAFIGKVGDDIYGRQLKKAAADAGIALEGLLTDREVHTTLAIVSLRPDGDRDFAFYRNPGADMNLKPDEVPEDLIRNARIFHFGTLSMTHDGIRKATEKALDVAKRSGCLISFDPNLRPPLWDSRENMLAQMGKGLLACDILKVSDDELLAFTGGEDVDAAAEKLLSDHPNIRLMTVTEGRNGSRGYFGGVRVKVPAVLSDKTVDTTGAGDTFGGCILDGVLKYGIDGLNAEKLRSVMTFAAAASSIVTTKKGALAVMPDRASVEKLIAGSN